MDEVERVGLWVGLIAGIVSIVLAAVALIFTYTVNRRSDQVSDQTIRALEKIEGSVERLSADTANLIKAGWDKMLGLGGPPVPTPPESPSDVEAGVEAEMRETLGRGPGERGDWSGSIDELIVNAQDAVRAGSLASDESLERPAEAIERVLSLLDRVSPAARYLARTLAFGPRHLTKGEYQTLRSDVRTTSAIRELRRSGLLVARTHKFADRDELVYYFPGRLKRLIRSAFMLRSPEEDSPGVGEALSNAGYGKDSLDELLP